MATIVRCDDCKRLSDEPGIGHIGREHTVIKYRDVLANIRIIGKDICRDCVKKMVAEGTLSKDDQD